MGALDWPLNDNKTLLVAPKQGFLNPSPALVFSPNLIIKGDFQLRERMMCFIGLTPLHSARLCNALDSHSETCKSSDFTICHFFYWLWHNPSCCLLFTCLCSIINLHHVFTNSHFFLFAPMKRIFQSRVLRLVGTFSIFQHGRFPLWEYLKQVVAM